MKLPQTPEASLNGRVYLYSTIMRLGQICVQNGVTRLISAAPRNFCFGGNAISEALRFASDLWTNGTVDAAGRFWVVDENVQVFEVVE